MSDGREIVTLMKDLHRLYSEAANLLQAADGVFKAAGWEADGNICKRSSNAVYKPEAWFAQDVYRCYHRSEGYEQMLVFLSVVFYDRDRPEAIDEPLVTVGLLDHGPMRTAEKWEDAYARVHLSMPDRQDNGHICAWTRPGVAVKYLTAVTLAVPLVNVCSVSDISDLAARILGEAEAIKDGR